MGEWPAIIWYLTMLNAWREVKHMNRDKLEQYAEIIHMGPDE